MEINMNTQVTQKVEPLPDTYTRGNAQSDGYFYHTRIDDKTQRKAMYRVTYRPKWSKHKKFVCYEVFEIKIQKEGDYLLGGVKVHYEAKEMKPSKTAFGLWAFSCWNRQDADICFNNLLKNTRTNV